MWDKVQSPTNIPTDVRALLTIAKGKAEVMNRLITKEELIDLVVGEDMERIRNTLALEGTYISKEDIETIYYGNLPFKFKSQQSLKEIINLINTIEIMYDVIEINQEFTEDILMEMHTSLSQGLLDRGNSGRCRDCMVTMSNNYKVAQINQVPKLIKQLLREMYNIEDPILRATFFSYNLLSIHPFKDYNGRLSRLCETLILLQHDYFPPIITSKERNQYITLLKISQEQTQTTNWEYTKWITNKVISKIDSIIEEY